MAAWLAFGRGSSTPASSHSEAGLKATVQELVADFEGGRYADACETFTSASLAKRGGEKGCTAELARAGPFSRVMTSRNEIAFKLSQAFAQGQISGDTETAYGRVVARYERGRWHLEVGPPTEEGSKLGGSAAGTEGSTGGAAGTNAVPGIGAPSFATLKQQGAYGQAREKAIAARTAAETYGTEHQESYLGLSIGVLEAMEPLLGPEPRARPIRAEATSGGTGFIVEYESEGPNAERFAISNSGGKRSYTCSPPNPAAAATAETTGLDFACPSTGNWENPQSPR